MFASKVSVLIPSYNQEEIIEQTLLSSLEQNYDNLEVVVTDDASTDSTPKILKSLESRYPGRLRIILNSGNVGVTRNHTRGLLACEGDFIAFLDGDDLFLPGKIRRQVEFLATHEDCAICCHDVDVFDSESGKTLYLWSERFGFHQGGMKALIRYGNFLPSVSVMVRKRFLPVYGYDERVRIGSDWLLWVETLAKSKGKIYQLNDVLARYRRHSENLTNTWSWKFEDQLVTLALIVTKWPEMAFSARIRQSELYFVSAFRAVMQKRYIAGLRFFGESLVLGFPLFVPAIRLIFRELRFLREHNGKEDDILGDILPKMNKE
jgi:glycosyltransferase involved in cell wall biosynthesis